jgi:hypothetical protein
MTFKQWWKKYKPVDGDDIILTFGPDTHHGLREFVFCAWEDSAKAERERLAIYWEDTEARAAEAHAAYQQEAHRRGDVRHADAYSDLPEATKE